LPGFDYHIVEVQLKDGAAAVYCGGNYDSVTFILPKAEMGQGPLTSKAVAIPKKSSVSRERRRNAFNGCVPVVMPSISA